ncbi:MAG TPA: rhombosortase [Gammaproteobacteria bacterium]|jgi:rhomboid family GlyGly-CTERM serine protease|nr:rhombosortase [Gammaproteobacteria bacterium]
MSSVPENAAGRLLRQHWPLLVLLVPCLLLAAAGEPARMLLRYDRAAIEHGEIWRLFSGNFVHLGLGHLLEDMAGLVLLWLLFEDVLPGWRTPAVVCLGSLAVGLGLLIGDRHVDWYVGISGALDTLWAAGALGLLRRRDRFGWMLSVVLLAKLVYEQCFGALPFSSVSSGGMVIVDAHLYGALAGALIGFGSALPWRRIMRGSQQAGDGV